MILSLLDFAFATECVVKRDHPDQKTLLLSSNMSEEVKQTIKEKSLSYYDIVITSFGRLADFMDARRKFPLDINSFESIIIDDIKFYTKHFNEEYTSQWIEKLDNPKTRLYGTMFPRFHR